MGFDIEYCLLWMMFQLILIGYMGYLAKYCRAGARIVVFNILL